MSTAPTNSRSETSRPQAPSSRIAASYTLYFTEPTADDLLQPMKRLRFATIPAAVDRALEMKREGKMKPVEIRDEQGRLVSCDLIGWRFSPLAPHATSATERWRTTA